MKKLMIAFMIILSIGMCSCTRTDSSTTLNPTTTSNTSLNSTTTSIEAVTTSNLVTTESLPPLYDASFIKKINLSNAVIEELNKADKVAYLSEDMIAYYVYGQTMTDTDKFYIFNDGLLQEYDIDTALGSLFLTYDETEDVAYYYEDGDVLYAGNSDNADDNPIIYASRIQYYNPYMITVGNDIYDYEGNVIFDTLGTDKLEFFDLDLGESPSFFTYNYYKYQGTVTNESCVINSYDSIIEEAFNTWTISDYGCGDAKYNGADSVILEIYDGSHLAGYASIDRFGEAAILTAADYLPLGASLFGFEPIGLTNGYFPYLKFEYENSDTSAMVSNQAITTVIESEYYDYLIFMDSILKFFNSNGKVSIYDGDTKVYEYQRYYSSGSVISVTVMGDDYMIYEASAFGTSYLSIYNYWDNDIITVLEGNLVDSIFIKYFLSDEDGIYYYDLETSEEVRINSGYTYFGGYDDFFALKSDTEILIYNSETLEMFALTRICQYARYLQPYALIGQYGNSYYIIG